MREMVIKDDITGRELAEADVVQVDVIIGERTGAIEGSQQTIDAIAALVIDHDPDTMWKLLGIAAELRAMMANTPQRVEAAKALDHDPGPATGDRTPRRAVARSRSAGALPGNPGGEPPGPVTARRAGLAGGSEREPRFAGRIRPARFVPFTAAGGGCGPGAPVPDRAPLLVGHGHAPPRPARCGPPRVPGPGPDLGRRG
jgi:hypothetical protein